MTSGLENTTFAARNVVKNAYAGPKRLPGDAKQPLIASVSDAENGLVSLTAKLRRSSHRRRSLQLSRASSSLSPGCRDRELR